MDTTERTVGGRYRLLERLGSGGMGTVWRAQDLVLDREVAVKEVSAPHGVGLAEQEVLRERTRREARAAARLDHPSAVTVYDVVEEDDQPYLVMELVEARTLSDVVTSDGPLSPQRTAEVGLELLGALEAAHAEGIVHRDVKPGNVLVRPDGRVVLTDFGIATSTGDSSITSTGLLLGSPSYIAPERARGEAPGPASDLWSLGATLFTAVEGKPPFDGGEPLLTVTAVVTGEHAPFVASGPLTDVLEGLLEKDPSARLDATAARSLLAAVAASAATTPLPSTPEPAAEHRAQGTQALPLVDVREVAESADLDHDAALPAGPTRLAPAVREPVRQEPRRHGNRAPAYLAAGLLTAVVGVAAWQGLGGEGDPGAAADSPSTAPSAAGPSPRSSGSSSGSSTGASTAALPDGWRRTSGPAGSTVAVPATYATDRYSGGVQYKDEATGRTLRVDTTKDGKGDAVQDRRDQAASFARRHEGYRELRIAEADYRDLEAADWEFTYRDEGAELHVLNRVFVTPDGRGWSLYFQTRGSDDWAAARADFDRIAAAFSTGD